MRAGILRHLITIERPTLTTDEYGESITAWTTFFETKASIQPLKGTERFYNHALHTEATHSMTFRFKEQITPVMRVKFQGRIFEITSALNINEANRTTLLMCKEIFPKPVETNPIQVNILE